MKESEREGKREKERNQSKVIPAGLGGGQVLGGQQKIYKEI